MRLEDVQAFVVVVEAQGITGAARRLGLTKSIVSRRLQRLEDSLSLRLIRRTKRGALLTEAGETFRDYAVRIAREVEAAEAALAPGDALRGRMRIAAPVSFGTLDLSASIAAFAALHPGLQIHTAYSDRIIDLMGEGFDVALRMGFLPDSELVAQRLTAVRGRMVASPAYLAARGEPRSPDELTAHDLISLGHEAWPLQHDGRVITIRPQGRFTADCGQALVTAAVEGLGVVLLPDFLADPQIAAGKLRAVMLDCPMPAAALFAVRPPGSRAPSKVAALIEFLRGRLGSGGQDAF